MAAQEIPSEMKQIMVKKHSVNFKEATEVVTVTVPKPDINQALVKVSYVAINASDILFTNGRYTPDAPLPYPAGLEAMGQVVALGEGSIHTVGQFVAFSNYGSFSEYVVVDDKLAFPAPSADPVVLNLAVSGSTASLALEKKGNLKKGEKVLVTAAAGATGQFAVQLAKKAGCHVIGTCSTEEKEDFLKSIGCDRPINYTKESLEDVLKKEYPSGVDVVYESIGKQVFETCLQNLAAFGRVIVIGSISAYEKNERLVPYKLPIPFLLLNKSADLSGFFLPCYRSEMPAHIAKLAKMIVTGELKAAVDNGEKAEKGPFKGIEGIYDAVDHMYAKKNTGKVVVQISD